MGVKVAFKYQQKHLTSQLTVFSFKFTVQTAKSETCGFINLLEKHLKMYDVFLELIFSIFLITVVSKLCLNIPILEYVREIRV